MPLDQLEPSPLQVGQSQVFRPVPDRFGVRAPKRALTAYWLHWFSLMSTVLSQVAQWIGAAHQDHPAGCLYVVATPIGNLADISVRALHVLSLADAIACEDTRHTQGMLRHYGLDKPLLAVHEHNEQEMAQRIVERLAAGERIAYVSDAGTPGVSDPGARLVAECQAAGFRCIPLPGPSSVTAALSVSGAVCTQSDAAGFVFAGFLDTRAATRAQQIQALQAEPRAVVLLEAPHRIAACLQALGVLRDRRITVAREISKQFEQIVNLPASALPGWLASNEHHAKGEFVLVIHPLAGGTSEHASGIPAGAETLLQALLKELPLKTAVKLTAELSTVSRNVLYERALAIKQAD